MKTFVRLLLAAILFIWLFYYLSQWNTTDNKDTIAFIESHCLGGRVVDWEHEVGVDSIDDLRWYLDDHNVIEIKYGKLSLRYKISDFITEEVQNDLRRVFITTVQNRKTLEFTLYFQGEEITRYAKK